MMVLQNYIAPLTYSSFHIAAWNKQQKTRENKEWTVLIDFTLCYKLNVTQGTKLLVFLEKQQYKSELKV